MSHPVKIITFYKFLPIDKRRLPTLKESITFAAKKHNIRGLIVLAEEGVNGTIAGLLEDIPPFKDYLQDSLTIQNLTVKNSSSASNPFKRFKVDIRPEIVTLGRHVPLPEMESKWHLSPEQWHKKITSGDDDYVLLDVRNHYESLLGKFKNSKVTGLSSFGEFPDYVESCEIDRNKKILMYCTGGIRCEKAALAMNNEGFEEVYQLQGGILKYLEEYPKKEFDGECFVFDDRVAVDQNLNPSNSYHLCPHCGDPGKIPISCKNCDKQSVICDRCVRVEVYRTCSKNCRYHFERISQGSSS